MNKLADATKQVEAATRELKREQDGWHTTLAGLKREKLSLTAKNRHLAAKNATLHDDVTRLEAEKTALDTNITERQEAVTNLDKKLDDLETKRADKATELADLQAEVSRRKATIDKELEDYAVARKTAIKDEILVVNDELVALNAQVADLNTILATKREELAVLNQTAIQEQQDLKVAHTSVDTDLQRKQEELVTLEAQITETKDSLQKLLYQRDNALMTVTKAEETHKEYLDYERKSRKILESKDRALQAQSAEIQQESQFLANRRSFLPPM